MMRDEMTIDVMTDPAISGYGAAVGVLGGYPMEEVYKKMVCCGVAGGMTLDQLRELAKEMVEDLMELQAKWLTAS